MENHGCVGLPDPFAVNPDGREMLFLELVALPLKQVLSYLLTFYFFLFF